MVRPIFMLLLIVSTVGVRDTEDAGETDSLFANLNERSEAAQMGELQGSAAEEVGTKPEDMPGKSSLLKRKPSALVSEEEEEYQTTLDKTVSKKEESPTEKRERLREEAMARRAQICKGLAKVQIGSGWENPKTKMDYCEAGFAAETRKLAFLKDLPVDVTTETKFEGTPTKIIETLMRRANETDEEGNFLRNMEVSCVAPGRGNGKTTVGMPEVYLAVNDASGVGDVGKTVQSIFTYKFSGVAGAMVVLAELPQLVQAVVSGTKGVVDTVVSGDDYGGYLEAVTNKVHSILADGEGTKSTMLQGQMTKANIDAVMDEFMKGGLFSKVSKGLNKYFGKKVIAKLTVKDPTANRDTKAIAFVCKEETYEIDNPNVFGEDRLRKRSRVFWPLHFNSANTAESEASDVKLTARHLAGLVAMLTIR